MGIKIEIELTDGRVGWMELELPIDTAAATRNEILFPEECAKERLAPLVTKNIGVIRENVFVVEHTTGVHVADGANVYDFIQTFWRWSDLKIGTFAEYAKAMLPPGSYYIRPTATGAIEAPAARAGGGVDEIPPGEGAAREKDKEIEGMAQTNIDRHEAEKQAKPEAEKQATVEGTEETKREAGPPPTAPPPEALSQPDRGGGKRAGAGAQRQYSDELVRIARFYKDQGLSWQQVAQKLETVIRKNRWLAPGKDSVPFSTISRWPRDRAEAWNQDPLDPGNVKTR